MRCIKNSEKTPEPGAYSPGIKKYSTNSNYGRGQWEAKFVLMSLS
jgi:hypothetical protein